MDGDNMGGAGNGSTLPPQDGPRTVNVLSEARREELRRQLQALRGGPQDTAVPTSPRARVAQWFRRTVEGVKELPDVLGRATMKAVDETSNSAVAVGMSLSETPMKAALSVSRATGLSDRFGVSEEEEEDFVEWYENASAEDINPFQFGDERRRRIFGADATGVLGFVEGAAQFGVGMLTTGRLLKGLGIADKAVKLGASKGVGAVLDGAVRGLGVDMTAFDPHTDRVANWVESGPSWLSNPVTRYLQNETDDSDLEARLKAGMEGLVLGGTIEGIIYAVKVAKISGRFKSGGLDEKTALRQIAEETEKVDAKLAAAPVVDEVRVEQAEDAEEWIPVLFKAGGEKVVDPAAPRFKTPAEAENHAAAVNTRLVNDRLDRTQATPEFIDQWRRLSEKHLAGDERGYEEILAETGMNVRWDLTPSEILSQMKAAVDVDPTFQKMLREKGSKTHAQALEEARAMFPAATPEAVLDFAAEIFGRTENLDVHLLALKQMTGVFGRVASKLNDIAQANPDNAIAFDNLGRALDSFLELEGYFAGSKSNVARGLAAMRKKTGGEIDEALAQDMAVRDYADEAVDPEIEELVSALDEVQQVKQRREQLINLKDTKGVSATDVQMARVYDKVKRLVDSENTDYFVDTGIGADSKLRKQDRSATLRGKADAAAKAGYSTTSQVDKPNVPNPGNPVFDLASWIDQAEASLSRQLEKARKGAAEKRAASEKGPLKDYIAADKARKKALKERGASEPGVVDLHGPRALGSTAAGIPLDKRLPSKNNRAFAGLTRQESLALSRQIMLSKGDPGKILLALRMPKRPLNTVVDESAWKKFIINYRINAMLSGPKTLLTNAVNNAIVAAQRPVEMWWAGKSSKNPALAQQGWDTMVGLRMYYQESWQMAKRAWDLGENILDVPRREISDINLTPMGDIKGARGTLGAIVQAPTRFLMATDEFFKQLNYRANLRGQVLRQAREQGITDPAKLAQRLSDDMHFATDMHGGAVNPLALEYSRTSTFTNQLEYGIGKWLQEGANNHVAIRFILPFVRTPVNIFRFTMQRTPGLARFTRQWKEAIKSGDQERIALMRAQEEVGAAIMGTAIAFVSAGEITGSGPSDPTLQRQMKDAGWQPYSIRLPNGEWVSYRRGDPTFALFGVVADMYQISQEMDDDSIGEAMYAGVAAVMSNVTSKTFMQGITEFLDALSSGRGTDVKHMVSSSFGSFIPNALRQSDPIETIAETRGLVDEMMARVPGFSATLEAKRNLFGEKVLRPPGYMNRSMNPFTVAPGASEDDVLFTLAQLAERVGEPAVSLPAESWNNGEIDITDRNLFDNGTGQSPYDRMQEILATELNLRGRLQSIMDSPSWDDMSDAVRYDVVRDVTVDFQETAEAMMLVEYPLLQQAMGQVEHYEGVKEALGREAARDQIMQSYENLFIKMK